MNATLNLENLPPREPPIAGSPIRLAVCASGGGTTLQNLIDRIGDGRLSAAIGVVIASKAGVGAIDRAKAAGLPVVVVERKGMARDEFSRRVFEAARGASADLVVLAGFLCLVDIPEDFEGRIINIHPSLLPAFGGKGFHGEAVHRSAIEAGVRFSGCTVHFVDATYDTGPIIHQAVVPVLDDDTSAVLASRVQAAECRALPEAIAMYADGRLRVEGRRVRLLDPIRE